MNFLDVLFPRRCLGCGKIGKYFCPTCVGKIRVIGERETICPVCQRSSYRGMTHARCKTENTIDGLTSFFRYDEIVKYAIKALKYRFVSDLATEFVSLVHTKLLIAKPLSSLVPIPLHSARLRFRGFNQAELLGRLIAEKLSIPMRTDLLVRSRGTTPQVDMKDRKERLKNMKNVFSHDSKFMIHDSIILFDDVFTTGATMRAAATVLKRAGVKEVWGMTMAR